MKHIIIIGATGSVGKSTLRVVARHPDRLRVVGLAAGSDGAGLIAAARAYGVRMLCLQDVQAARRWSLPARDAGCELLSGPAGLRELACLPQAEGVVAASPGTVALPALFEALKAGKFLALANKESLVLGGHLLMPEANKQGKSLIYPIDSEHAALAQCLKGEALGQVQQAILTASGGPFLKHSLTALAQVTPAEALKHPTWRMGAKVSLDCATMANKGLELMEAHWLFGLKPEHIDAWVHPQSLVHALVELSDGSLIAHMGPRCMTLAIQYGLLHGERRQAPCERLQLKDLKRLDFSDISPKRYPCYFLARQALTVGGTAPAIFNAANTVAGAAFLEGKISFLQIASIIDKALKTIDNGPFEPLETMIELDAKVQELCRRWVARAEYGA